LLKQQKFVLFAEHTISLTCLNSLAPPVAQRSTEM